MADDKPKKQQYIDNGWPSEDGHADHAVSEFASSMAGALSPFGEVQFPLPSDELPFVQPRTIVNR